MAGVKYIECDDCGKLYDPMREECSECEKKNSEVCNTCESKLEDYEEDNCTTCEIKFG